MLQINILNGGIKMLNLLITGACGVTSRSVVRSLNKSDIFKGKINFITAGASQG